jgi:hypothetical protein
MNTIAEKYAEAIDLLNCYTSAENKKNLKKCIKILEQHRDAAIKRAEAPAKPANKWVTFVKQYCEDNDANYREAMKDPEVKEAYQKANKTVKKSPPEPKGKPPKEPKEKQPKEPKQSPATALRWNTIPEGYRFRAQQKTHTMWFKKVGDTLIETDEDGEDIGNAPYTENPMQKAANDFRNYASIEYSISGWEFLKAYDANTGKTKSLKAWKGEPSYLDF